MHVCTYVHIEQAVQCSNYRGQAIQLFSARVLCNITCIILPDCSHFFSFLDKFYRCERSKRF